MSSEQKEVASNVVWHHATVTRARREVMNGHRGAIIWFTGLSGAGKSTLAHAVEEVLHQRGCRTFVLDGDNVRHGLCRDLGFTVQDRSENIRRVGEVAKLMVDAGLIVLASFISPYRAERQMVRDLLAPGEFVEVFVDTSLEVCAARDVKGLYAKAMRGEIANFTGVSSPYEAPEAAELVLDGGATSPEALARQVLDLVERFQAG